MKWFLLLVIIGGFLFAYNQQQQIAKLNEDLAKASAQIEALQKRLQKPPQNPYFERQAGPLGSGNQSPWGKDGNPLDASPQGNAGGNRGGGPPGGGNAHR